MSYELALTKAWQELESLSKVNKYSVILLADTYEIIPKDKLIFSNSCNVPPKDYVSILLLHYLVGSLRGDFSRKEEWISFKEVKGGEIYYPAFHEGAIKPLLAKFGNNPKALLNVLERFKGKVINEGDAAIEIDAFQDIAIRIIIWKGDEEFDPEANLLFDRCIQNIFSMEDIAVLSRFIAHNL